MPAPRKLPVPQPNLLSFEKVLILVGGTKGGVGKSVLTKVASKFFLDRQIPFYLAECDRETPDVGLLYEPLVGGSDCFKKVLYAYFSEDPTKRTKADTLFNYASQGRVLANLPANAHQAVCDWFVKDRLYEIAQEHGIQFVHVYVSNGGSHSIKSFLRTLRDLGSYMHHVLVRNQGLCDEWSHLDSNSELQSAIAKYKVRVIDFPKLPYAENYFMDERQITFSQALKHPDLTIPQKQRLRSFLREAFEQIKKLEGTDA